MRSQPSASPPPGRLVSRRATHSASSRRAIDATGLTIPLGVAEFTFDTTRAVANMLYSGALERYPSIRYIVSHAGGAIPYLAWRIAGASYLPELRDRAPKTDGLALLQKMHYDTALSTSEFVFGPLKQFVPTSHVLFGSDFPYVTPAVLQAEKVRHREQHCSHRRGPRSDRSRECAATVPPIRVITLTIWQTPMTRPKHDRVW